MLLLAALLAGCKQSAPLPDVGDCATYPEGVYEFGEIGIGTCLSGPVDLAFTSDEAGDPVLLVTNANPYKLFTGGSLLAIPWGAVDLEAGRNVVSELGASAIDLPDFVGGMAIQNGTAMIASRLSEGAATRAHADDLHLVNIDALPSLSPSSRGTDGGSTITLRSDPMAVVLDPTSNFTFVGNRTSHTISVLDGSGDTIKVVDPWPEAMLSSSTFSDADGSGSTASVTDLDIWEADLLTDDRWTLSWIEGTWRLWLPTALGFSRTQTTGSGVYTASGLGVELLAEDLGDGLTLADPDWVNGGRLYFEVEGEIWYAASGDWLGDWSVADLPSLSGRPGEWDEVVSGPSIATNADGYYLFYDGLDAAGAPSKIGRAFAAEGEFFQRKGAGEAERDPVFAPDLDYAAGGVSDPFVLFDVETDLWDMYFTAEGSDGRLTIGHATSPDLLVWTADAAPAFEIEGLDVAAPAIAEAVGEHRLWFAVSDGLSWQIGAALKRDGVTWTDLGPVLDTDAPADGPPPGVALQAAPTHAFHAEGEHAGSLNYPVEPASEFIAFEDGWQISVLVGATLAPGDAGAESAGGLHLDSVDAEAGLAWLTVRSEGGTNRIRTATYSPTGDIVPDSSGYFGGTDGFDRDGVSSATVLRVDGTYYLYYAGTRSSRTVMGLATSNDGRTWTRVGEVLDHGGEGDWDAASVVPTSIEALGDGEVRVWYAGFDGDVWRVGSASGALGERLSRDGSKGLALTTGSPGDWDDSGVRDPYILRDLDDKGDLLGHHLWYSGFDGDLWRMGYAYKAASAEDFSRSLDETTAEPRPIMGTEGATFHPDGVGRPVVLRAADGSYTGTYAGLNGSETFVGRFTGAAPDRLHKRLSLPTLGDTLTFSTERGDPDQDSIPLDTYVEDVGIVGIGLTSLTVDSERGFLYVSSKLLPYITVLDIRDDSTEAFQDLNYLDVEAVLAYDNASDADGFRGVVVIPGEDRLYAVNDEPEGIWTLDISSLVDDAFSEFIYDTVIGWLPAPRSGERDEGVSTMSSVGPATLLPDPDGQRLYLTNFNANSLTVYDLDLGPNGTLTDEIPNLGENPYGMVLTPDGKHVVIANYGGEVAPSGLALSTLAVMDIDETSPTYLEVLTWIVDR